jgi:uncharacterized Zn finger protein (UPF0148 family)
MEIREPISSRTTARITGTGKVTAETLLPCDCCASPVIRERGTFEICPVCGWEDDPAQARDPELAGGANRMSLNEARARWRRSTR